jgi:hypothetical protein
MSEQPEFMECATCRAKPGSPMLCESCLHNRTTINWLRGELGRVDDALDEFAPNHTGQSSSGSVEEALSALRVRLAESRAAWNGCDEERIGCYGRAKRAEARVAELEKALRLTLETHDQGHSPCACIHARAALSRPSGAEAPMEAEDVTLNTVARDKRCNAESPPDGDGFVRLCTWRKGHTEKCHAAYLGGGKSFAWPLAATSEAPKPSECAKCGLLVEALGRALDFDVAGDLAEFKRLLAAHKQGDGGK